MLSLLAEKTQNHHLKSFLLTDLEDRNSFSDHCCEGDGSLRANQAVAKVDHLQAPQVCQSLRRQQRMHEYANPHLCSLLGIALTEFTFAIASVPFLVKVLSLKFRTRSSRLCRIAEANATTPAWLIPFWGMWTSSRLPMS